MFAATPAKLEDVRRLVDIEFHAFENERVNQVLSYRDYTEPDHFERSVKLYQDALNDQDAPGRTEGERIGRIQSDLDDLLSHSRTTFKKIVDVETNEIISFTKYELKTYTEEELESAADSGHEGEPEMNRKWFALNEQLKRDYVRLAKHCCGFS